jgi:hypothetical protein
LILVNSQGAVGTAARLDLTTDSGANDEVRVRFIGDSEGADQAGGRLIIQTNSAGDALVDRLTITSGGDCQWYEDTGTTPKMTWDASASSLGIGTEVPGTLLELKGSGSDLLTVNSTSSYTGILFEESGTSRFALRTNDGTSGLKFYDTGASAERMRIDSSGNVNIPSGNLGVGFSAAPAVPLHITDALPRIALAHTTANLADGVVAGELLLGTTANTFSGVASSADAAIKAISEETQSGSTHATGLAFYTKPTGTGPGSTLGATERMRITSGGTVALKEVAAAAGDVAGRGQIWVKNDAPNTLWFTDDLGNDKQLDTAEIGIAVSDETTALTTGDAKATLLVPRNMTITEVKASLTGADTGAYNLEVDVRYNATAGSAGTTIFSADLEITAGDYYATKTGATAFVGSASSKAVAENGALYIDINDSSGSAIFDCTGLKVWLLGYWN